MKTFANIGLVLALVSFVLSMYTQFVLVPKKNTAWFIMENRPISGDADLSYYDSPGYKNAFSDYESSSDLITYIGIFSIIAAAVCLIVIIKIRNAKSFIALVLSLIALLIFLIHGTHMFS